MSRCVSKAGCVGGEKASHDAVCSGNAGGGHVVSRHCQTLFMMTTERRATGFDLISCETRRILTQIVVDGFVMHGGRLRSVGGSVGSGA